MSNKCLKFELTVFSTVDVPQGGTQDGTQGDWEFVENETGTVLL